MIPNQVRLYSGVPPVSAFGGYLGTPIVIDVTTDTAYYLKVNTVTALAGGGGGGSPGAPAFSVQFNNAGAFGGIALGAAGEILTSNGAGAAATFQAAPGGGITQLTGDVTAGPGSGSQVATLGKIFYAEFWHCAYGGI